MPGSYSHDHWIIPINQLEINKKIARTCSLFETQGRKDIDGTVKVS